MGPRTITVGRESTYHVHLMNSGEVAAEDLVVHVMLPAWAEVTGIEASLGDARPPEASTSREETLIVECDPRHLEDVRRNWPFLRDRRIDAYGPILNRVID